jgi:hypothetical protein
VLLSESATIAAARAADTSGDRVPGVSAPHPRSHPRRPAPDRGGLTRRTALRGGLLVTGTLALAGCQSGADPADTSTPTGAATAAPEAEADDDPDVRLLDDLVGEVEDTWALVVATGRRHRRLRAPLRPLADLHVAHREVLGEATGSAGEARSRGRGGASVPRDRTAALDAVGGREERLARTLAEGAVVAESGSFARVLASMSAGVAQHLAEVPR